MDPENRSAKVEIYFDGKSPAQRSGERGRLLVVDILEVRYIGKIHVIDDRNECGPRKNEGVY